MRNLSCVWDGILTLRMVIFSLWNNQYWPLPLCSPTVLLFLGTSFIRPFPESAVRLGTWLDCGTCRLGHELYTDKNSAEHLRRYRCATSIQDFCKGARHNSGTFGASFWRNQGSEHTRLQNGSERRVREVNERVFSHAPQSSSILRSLDGLISIPYWKIYWLEVGALLYAERAHVVYLGGCDSHFDR